MLKTSVGKKPVYGMCQQVTSYQGLAAEFIHSLVLQETNFPTHAHHLHQAALHRLQGFFKGAAADFVPEGKK